jgi:hypothetical protein
MRHWKRTLGRCDGVMKSIMETALEAQDIGSSLGNLESLFFNFFLFKFLFRL